VEDRLGIWKNEKDWIGVDAGNGEWQPVDAAVDCLEQQALRVW
jgi:hypothetical protein